MRRALTCLASWTMVAGKTYFFETFDDALEDQWRQRWVRSTQKMLSGEAGGWVLRTGLWFGDYSEDLGLQTNADSKWYQLSAAFDSFSNAGKQIIIQYQLKYENDIECGGGYIKVGPKMPDQEKFDSDTPYNIMFGPDKCGETKRTHLIFSYKGKNVMKKIDLPYKQEPKATSHLYRMVLRPNNSVKVVIDGENVYDGSLKDDWELLPPKEIADPADKKPDDWIDAKNMMIDDPTDEKPDYWVEESRIVDELAKRPDDWDDEDDGEWVRPMKDNEAYKGVWLAKRIPNPNYKGFWEAKRIANPEFQDDDKLYKYDFGYVGIDLWQVTSGSIFDNIIITDKLREADAFAKKWKMLSKAEKKKMEAHAKKNQKDVKKKEAEEHDPDFDDDWNEIPKKDSKQPTGYDGQPIGYDGKPTTAEL